jgi:nicotinamide riboside kinase
MDNIKIALSAAQSQGKTTLLNRLSLDPFLASKNFQFQASTIRDITKQYGIEVNDLGSDLTQILVMAKHIENAYKKGNWILDRCVLDSIAYGYCSKLETETYATNLITLKQLMPKYNLVFYIEPELPVVDDGFRSVDKVYFKKIVDSFEYYISHESAVIRLSGSIEERYNKVMEEIKKLYD